MSETERICKRLGIKMMKPDDPRMQSLFGSYFVPGRLGGLVTGGVGMDGVDTDGVDTSGEVADSTPPAKRGEDPEVCPFNTMHAEFGEGSWVVIPPSLLEDLLEQRFGGHPYLAGITHLLWDRDNYDEDELDEGFHGLVTTPPFSNGVRRKTVRRTSPVSIRREGKFRIVISQRNHASDPMDSHAGTDGCMRIHRGDPRWDDADLFEEHCTCIATEPYTRWLVEGDSAKRLEVALRRTDELVEFGVYTKFGVYGKRSALRHSTWLIGRARGGGAALWPTAQNSSSTIPTGCKSIFVGDTCVGHEVRRELVRLNELHGIPVPGKYHGDLDAVSAWHILLKRTRR